MELEPYTIAAFCLCVTTIVIGVPSNLTILYIYFKKKKRSSSHSFIIGHAVVDLVICSVVLPIGAAQFLTLEKFRSEFLCKLVMWLNIAAPLASLHVNTVVAFDRFFAVTRPHSRFVRGKRGPTILVIFVILVAFVINVPQLFWWSIRDDMSNGQPSCYLSVHGVARTLALIPISFVYAILIFVTLVLYALIYCKVKKLRKNQVVSIHLAEGISAGVKSSVQTRGVSTTFTNVPAPMPSTSIAQSLQVVQGWKENVDDKVSKTAGIHSNQGDTEATNVEQNTSSSAPRPSGDVEHGQALVNATFRMLFIVSAIFIFTWLLQTALRFIPRSLTEQLRHESPGWYAVFTVVQYVIVVNSCVNLGIYAIVNREFRNELRTLTKNMVNNLNKLCHRS